MSEYIRETVLRVPVDKYFKFESKDAYEDFMNDMESKHRDLFRYCAEGKFQFAPTEARYIDYVIRRDDDACGEYGKTRAMYETEERRFFPLFQKIIPDIDMKDVRVVEFCWYNCCEAPNYYNESDEDPFYDELF